MIVTHTSKKKNPKHQHVFWHNAASAPRCADMTWQRSGGIVLHLHAHLTLSPLFLSSEGITVGGMLGTTGKICAKCKFDVVFKIIALMSPVHVRRISICLSWKNGVTSTGRHQRKSVSHNKSHSRLSYTKIGVGLICGGTINPPTNASMWAANHRWAHTDTFHNHQNNLFFSFFWKWNGTVRTFKIRQVP